MSTSVLIVDPTPVYRRGLAGALSDAGYLVAEAPGFADWDESEATQVIVVTVRSPHDLDAITEVTASESPVKVVALIEGREVEQVADVLRAGGAAVAERDARPELIASAVRVVLEGHTLVPHWAAVVFAARIPARPSPDQWVSDAELHWLRLLGRGTTVATLANEVGYSEREMFRNLHDLYARIRVRNRTEALLWAERLGLLEPDVTQERTSVD
jgi:DNA-binding NarL/FixJ family response regulator